MLVSMKQNTTFQKIFCSLEFTDFSNWKNWSKQSTLNLSQVSHGSWQRKRICGVPRKSFCLCTRKGDGQSCRNKLILRLATELFMRIFSRSAVNNTAKGKTFSVCSNLFFVFSARNFCSFFVPAELLNYVVLLWFSRFLCLMRRGEDVKNRNYANDCFEASEGEVFIHNSRATSD